MKLFFTNRALGKLFLLPLILALAAALINAGVPSQHVVDMNGDGRTDWTVVRGAGGPNGQITWFTWYNGQSSGQTDVWGIETDSFVPGNYDADTKTDVAVWRPGAAGSAIWYILQSTTGTLRAEYFGLSSDDPSVVGDYNGDGVDDIAVYRSGAAAGDPSYWFWRATPNGPYAGVQWGQNGDFPAPGDYDGDGKNDFVVQRNGGGGQARFWRLFAAGFSDSVAFGFSTDVIVPGDYDGDLKTDIAVVRTNAPSLTWFVLPSTGSPLIQMQFGDTSTDFLTQGDYDGDGKTDIAVWRSNSGIFYVNNSATGLQEFDWGQNGDYPPAAYNSH